MSGLRKLLFDRRNSSNYLITFFCSYYFLMLIFGALSTRENATVNQILIWGVSPILVLLFIEHSSKNNATLSSESLRFLFFLVFVLQSRLYSVDTDLYDKAFRKVLLNVFLFVIIEYFIFVTGEIKLFFIVTLIGCTFICYYMLTAPRSEERLIDYEGFVIENDLMNTNGIANYAIEGVLAFLFLWYNLKNKWAKYISYLALPILILAIIGAASKAGLLGLFVCISAWVLFCLGTSMRNKLTFIGIILGMAVGLLLANEYIVENTYLGQRLQSVGKIEEYYESDSRGLLIAVALELFIENPFFGVGLMQVAANNSRGAYSHNDYVEILSNFGLIGAAIYFPIFIIIWRRLTRNLSMIRFGHIDTKYNLNFMRAMFVVLAIRGISVPIFTAFDEMILFGIIGGYALYCEKTLTKAYSFNHKIASL
jgi:O-antigen ligase